MSGKFVTGLPPGFGHVGDAVRCPGLLVRGLERVATGLGSEPNTAEERRRVGFTAQPRGDTLQSTHQ